LNTLPLCDFVAGRNDKMSVNERLFKISLFPASAPAAVVSKSSKRSTKRFLCSALNISSYGKKETTSATLEVVACNETMIQAKLEPREDFWSILGSYL
jgi:hypothetical protein